MLLSDAEENQVWDWIDENLRFQPSVDPYIRPFSIKAPHVVYDIGGMRPDQQDAMDRLITEVFIRCTKEGEKLYALDWHHSCFKFDPRHEEERKSFWVDDDRYMGGGYYAYFPGYYPDGDYYFFLDCRFRYGYLGHPWQKTVWLFGEELIRQFADIEGQLGWRRVK